jgi:tRNA(adenine34) deaminase
MKRAQASSLNEKYMLEALKEAKKAGKKGEVPVGAIVVLNNKVIGRGYNRNISLNDASAHAEIQALRKASGKLKNYRLNSSKLYVTLEPCSMCAGALVLARVSEIIFGAHDPKTGACGSVFNLADNKKLNHRIKLTGGVLESECSSLLKKFFEEKRNGRK